MKIAINYNTNHKMVELKARVDELNVLRKKLSVIGAKYIGEVNQSDEYFVVPEGRLKLRTIKDSGTVELIYYERENIFGPKRDDVYILRVKESNELKSILKKILKPLIVIEKDREIYEYQGTQIHLDHVKNLGKFIEFERKTSDNQKSVEKNQRILKKMMEKFEIPPRNLESLSYSDLVET